MRNAPECPMREDFLATIVGKVYSLLARRKFERPMKQIVLTSLCITIFFFCNVELQAGLVNTFSNRASFQTDLTSSQNIGFEGNHPSAWNAYLTPAGYTSNGVNMVGPLPIFSSYYLYVMESTTNPYASNFGNMTTGDALLGEGRGSIDMTFPGGVNAIGLDFVATEVTPGTPVSFTFLVNGTEQVLVTNSATNPSFFGVVSDEEITEFSVRTTSVSRPPQFIIDNVTFGAVTLVATPEPTTALMFGAGLGAIVFRRRRSLGQV